MNIPGRIIIVDDDKEDVEDLIDSLTERGENVYYTPGLLENDECLFNTRLLIIDYYLLGDIEQSLEVIVSILNKINNRTSFFLVVIWSHYVTVESSERIMKEIKNRYKDKYNGKETSAIFLSAFKKEEVEYENLIKKIDDFINKNAEIGLLYEYEKVVECARDKTVSDIVDVGDISIILKTLKSEVGEESLNRYLINIYNNIFKRYIEPTETLDSCVKKILESIKDVTYEQYGFLHNLQSYYYVSDNEQIWTGDILEELEKSKYFIVLTPECDFAQKKVNYIHVIEANKINHEELKNKEKLKEIKDLYGLKINTNKVIDAIFMSKSLPSRYATLCYLKNKGKEEFFHLILDFQKSKHIDYKYHISDYKQYKRICRIDNPLINNIQQKYSALCSRIGIMAIPEEVANDTRKTIR